MAEGLCVFDTLVVLGGVTTEVSDATGTVITLIELEPSVKVYALLLGEVKGGHAAIPPLQV